MAEQQPQPTRVFYSYSHKDAALRDELETHLAALKRGGIIQGWSDRDITGGQDWAGQIDSNLEAADMILLLISADFINSDYCYDKEMAHALERHAAGTVRVIPIIVRPVDWESTPFHKLQAFPSGAKAVTTWLNRDEAWVDVVRGIRQTIQSLTRERLARQDAALAEQARQVELAQERHAQHEADLVEKVRQEAPPKPHPRSQAAANVPPARSAAPPANTPPKARKSEDIPQKAAAAETELAREVTNEPIYRDTRALGREFSADFVRIFQYKGQTILLEFTSFRHALHDVVYNGKRVFFSQTDFAGVSKPAFNPNHPFVLGVFTVVEHNQTTAYVVMGTTSRKKIALYRNGQLIFEDAP